MTSGQAPSIQPPDKTLNVRGKTRTDTGVACASYGLLLLLLFTGCSVADGEGLGPIADYGDHFEYRYDDSPSASEAPQSFADPLQEDGKWRKVVGVGNPPGRGKARVLWLRTRLQGAVLEQPVLTMRLATRTLQAYVDGKSIVPQLAKLLPIERYVNLRREYLIALSPDYVGKTLALRLVSDAPALGLESVPRLGEATAVAVDLIGRNSEYLLCAVLLLILTICGIVLFLFRRDDSLYLYFSIACFGFGVSFLTFSGVGGILFRWPFPHYPMQVLTNAVGNIGFISFVILITGSGPLRILNGVRLLYGMFIVALLGAMALHPEWVHRLTVPNRMLSPIFGVAIITTGIRGMRWGGSDAKLLSIGLLLCTLISIPDLLHNMGRGVGKIGQSYVPTILAFILTLLVLLVRRFARSHSQTLKLQFEHDLARRKMHEQEALLLASGRMAKGDLEQPISADPASPLLPLALALEGMRQDLRSQIQLMAGMQSDLRSKVATLETRNREIGHLNDELRRQIEQRSKRLIDVLLPAGATMKKALELRRGELLGEHYRVLRKIGQGGMGVVYEVRRATDGRHLAAKVLRGAGIEKSALGRFAREAQIMARLNHPNLISISDVDVTNQGIVFLIMELVRGRSLAQLHSRFSDIAWDLLVLSQVADGLAALHACGIVHRDIKPENVLVEQAGERPLVKLADLGISRIHDDRAADHTTTLSGDDSPADSAPRSGDAWQPIIAPTEGETDDTGGSSGERLALSSEQARPQSLERPRRARAFTQTGVVLGTPGYLAPEILHGQGSRHAQPPSDVFSLAVMAVEMFTGKRPAAAIFPSPNLDPGRTPRHLLQECETLDARLRGLLEQALSVDPKLRPTAEELARALRQDAVAA